MAVRPVQFSAEGAAILSQASLSWNCASSGVRFFCMTGCGISKNEPSARTARRTGFQKKYLVAS
jgi:hypothetical protein